MKKMRVGVLALFALLAACSSILPPPETTEEGLVRVPSRPEGGVYRRPGVDFMRYKRLVIEPLTVEFIKGWRKQHPDVSELRGAPDRGGDREEFPRSIHRNPRR